METPQAEQRDLRDKIVLVTDDKRAIELTEKIREVAAEHGREIVVIGAPSVGSLGKHVALRLLEELFPVRGLDESIVTLRAPSHLYDLALCQAELPVEDRPSWVSPYGPPPRKRRR